MAKSQCIYIKPLNLGQMGSFPSISLKKKTTSVLCGVLKNIDWHNFALFVFDVPESPWITITYTNGLIFHDVFLNIIYLSYHFVLSFAFLHINFGVKAVAMYMLVSLVKGENNGFLCHGYTRMFTRIFGGS